MLTFFRKNAPIIGWCLAIFFGATMFTGSLFFGLSQKKPDSKSVQLDPSLVLASIGDVQVDYRKYNEIQQNMFRGIEPSISDISPDLLELYQLNAFNQALNYSIFLDGARKLKLKPSKHDILLELEQVYKQYDLKDKKALKALLKKNNYPYKAFLNTIEESILVKKFELSLQDQATVSTQDLKEAFTKRLVQYLYIPHILEDADDTLENPIIGESGVAVIDKALSEGTPFETLIKRYSHDATRTNKGLLGWVDMGTLDIAIENTLISLQKGSISGAIHTPNGYHWVKVLNIKITPKPPSLSDEELREQLLNKKQQQLVQRYFSDRFKSQELIINNPMVRAIKSKFSGDYDAAIQSYESIISENPSSVLPHYHIARIYSMINAPEKAYEQLQKADIKSELSSTLDFPELHLEYGNHLVKSMPLPKGSLTKINKQLKLVKETSKDNKTLELSLRRQALITHKVDLVAIIEQYRKALNLSLLKKNRSHLETLRIAFSDLNQTDDVAKIDETLLLYDEEQRLKTSAAENASKHTISPSETN